jgi:phytoene dehydrogenase-like protein
MPKPDVLIVGAGLAGLCCALELQKSGVSCQILEASDGVGGRVRTDEYQGFLLDRGFQVYLDAYPEGKRVLDYGDLDLRPFFPGALIRFSGKWYRMADPYRDFRTALTNAFNPIGSLGDKYRMLQLRKRVFRWNWRELFGAKEMGVRATLDGLGFSARMINRFFRPLYGGVSLDPSLTSSSRMFEFYFRMALEGNTSLPNEGMGAIPAQIALKLKPGTIGLEQRVTALDENTNRLTLATGEELSASTIVLATEGPEASRLVPSLGAVRSRHLATVYFAAPRVPKEGPWLMLNGNNEWPVNHAAVVSEIAPGYAPPDQSLIAATVLGKMLDDETQFALQVKDQLKRWFGRQVDQWKHLRTYKIAHAHPEVAARALEERPPAVRPGVHVCGDHRAGASIHHAMLSGRRTAESILETARA